VGLSPFGASGPEADLFRHFGIPPEAIVAEVGKRLLPGPSRTGTAPIELEMQ
jgi:hypothetical protein